MRQSIGGTPTRICRSDRPPCADTRCVLGARSTLWLQADPPEHQCVARRGLRAARPTHERTLGGLSGEVGRAQGDQLLAPLKRGVARPAVLPTSVYSRARIRLYLPDGVDGSIVTASTAVMARAGPHDRSGEHHEVATGLARRRVSAPARRVQRAAAATAQRHELEPPCGRSARATPAPRPARARAQHLGPTPTAYRRPAPLPSTRRARPRSPGP